MSLVVRIFKDGITIDGKSVGCYPGWCLKSKVIELLMLRRDYVSVNDFMDHLYSEDPDPPYDPIIAVTISRVRRLLKGFGIEIENRQSAGWRINNRPIVKVMK